jgi:hypothetical protein
LNASLKKVDLSWNHIRSQGAAVLSKGLGVNFFFLFFVYFFQNLFFKANTTVEEIDLSYNGFSTEGALAIVNIIFHSRFFQIIFINN